MPKQSSGFVYTRTLDLQQRQGLSIHAEQDVEIKRSGNILTIWSDGICLLRIYAPSQHVRIFSNLFQKEVQDAVNNLANSLPNSMRLVE